MYNAQNFLMGNLMFTFNVGDTTRAIHSYYWARQVILVTLSTMCSVVTIDESLGNNLCHFRSYNAVENEAHFVLEYPHIKDRFPLLSENAVLESLRSFFRFDRQVEIILYVTQATTLCHSKDLAGYMTQSRCTFGSHWPFGFPNFKINFVHWIDTTVNTNDEIRM